MAGLQYAQQFEMRVYPGSPHKICQQEIVPAHTLARESMTFYTNTHAQQSGTVRLQLDFSSTSRALWCMQDFGMEPIGTGSATALSGRCLRYPDLEHPWHSARGDPGTLACCVWPVRNSASARPLSSEASCGQDP